MMIGPVLKTKEPRLLNPIPNLEPYPHELDEAESELLKARSPRPKEAGYVGFGLSGGGIRSATLSLGVFQVFAREKLLKYIDILSTVSGGGYFGSFFGSLFCRYENNTNHLEEVQETLADANSEPVRFLRENGRYLAPNGFGDLLMATTMLLRNWISVAFFVALSVMSVMIGLTLLRWVVDQALPIDLFQPPESSFWWWSPIWWIPLAITAFALSLGVAYWIVPYPQGTRRQQVLAWSPVLWAFIGAFIAYKKGPWKDLDDNLQYVIVGFVVIGAIATIVRLAAGLGLKTGGAKNEGAHTQRVEEVASDAMRTRLSRLLTVVLVLTAVTAVVAMIDTLGQTAYHIAASNKDKEFLLALVGTVTGIVAFSRKLMALLGRDGSEKRLPVPQNILASIVSFGLLAVGLVLINALCHGLAWMWLSPLKEGAVIKPMALVVAFVLVTGLAYLMGLVWPFVNRSTMHPFYEARLRRAYLGATNPDRHRNNVPVVKGDPNDGLEMVNYRPENHGGPLHLVNVTVNETVSGESKMQQQDRKGLGMAIGPAGISVSRRHHALWTPVDGAVGNDDSFRVFPIGCEIDSETLDLDDWVAISGAAVSTGMGSRTSIGLALLLGLLNVRLGYWWDSGVQPDGRGDRFLKQKSWPGRIGAQFSKFFPAHTSLLDEWFARFHGVARQHWNLSDGGHFENMGGYELIRRRLPFIVICDFEQDVDYCFGGLANLVRKARTDFNTEIRFLSEGEVEAVVDPSVERWIGTLTELERPKEGRSFSNAHAAIALIDYRDPTGTVTERQGIMLYIKPSLLGDEPTDLLVYHSEHEEFPHESTADQFFDEAQWESYRCLGEQIAHRVFTKSQSEAVTENERGWFPVLMLENPSRGLQLFKERMKNVANSKDSESNTAVGAC